MQNPPGFLRAGFLHFNGAAGSRCSGPVNPPRTVGSIPTAPTTIGQVITGWGAADDLARPTRPDKGLKRSKSMRKSWRDVIKVHPAADLFPLMSESELRELGEDIKANGLQHVIVLHEGKLIDGRNRLDAMELVGITLDLDDGAARVGPEVHAARQHVAVSSSKARVHGLFAGIVGVFGP